jgi:hypothetical protein
MTWDALMANTRIAVAWAAVQAALLVAAWDLGGLVVSSLFLL